jgi:hypothetical protein
MSRQAIVAAAGPSFGPAIVTLFGVDIPIFALALSVAALILARQIAKPPERKLTARQEFSLTVVLIIVLFLVVTGQLFGTKMLGAGWAVVWAIGLGMTGILILEIFADYVTGFVRRFLELFKFQPPKE